MVNENTINIPQGINISKLNIAFELMWLNILYKEGYVNEEQYFKIKQKIKIKYM